VNSRCNNGSQPSASFSKADNLAYSKRVAVPGRGLGDLSQHFDGSQPQRPFSAQLLNVLRPQGDSPSDSPDESPDEELLSPAGRPQIPQRSAPGAPNLEERQPEAEPPVGLLRQARIFCRERLSKEADPSCPKAESFEVYGKDTSYLASISWSSCIACRPW
jgi:hypothetical protein